MQPRILIVDDQALVLDALKKILSCDYSVFCAKSADEALDLLARQAVDVVISDELMPGMPGSQFLAIVRDRYPETVRIILTGHASLESAIRAINEGEIYRFLTKPCKIQELRAAVQAALAHKSGGRPRDQRLSCIDRLEKEAPGITRVKQDDDGVVIIDQDDL